MAKKKPAPRAAARKPAVSIRDVELVLKRSVVRKGGLAANSQWKQTYTGGAGTPRDSDDLDCES